MTYPPRSAALASTPPAQREAEFLDALDACHLRARKAMAAQAWSALNDIALELEALSTQLSLAIAEGFNSVPVERRLSDLIDFFRKAMAQAAAADNALRQKEDDLRRERQKIVTDSAASQ